MCSRVPAEGLLITILFSNQLGSMSKFVNDQSLEKQNADSRMLRHKSHKSTTFSALGKSVYLVTIFILIALCRLKASAVA